VRKAANQLRQSFCKDFALTQRIAAEEFAHAEDQLDTATTAWDISHSSAIPAVKRARWVATQGTAGCEMRRDDRDMHLVFAGLDVLNLHPLGKREQGIAFHHDLISLSTPSHEFL
jgi:hypothetical protein